MTKNNNIHDNDNWINAFKKSVEGFDEKLPEGGWERLSGRLDKIQEKRSLRASGKKRYIAVAAAFCGIIIGVTIMFYHNNDESIRHAMVNDLSTPESCKHHLVRNKKMLAQKEEMAPATERLVHHYKTPDNKINEKENKTGLDDKSVTEPENRSADIKNETTDMKEDIAGHSNKPVNPTENVTSHNSTPSQLYLAENTSGRSHFTLGVFVNISPSMPDMSTEPSYNMLSSSLIQSLPDELPPGTEWNSFDLEDYYTYRHKQPISFGITVQKKISARLAVESGIIYSILMADVTKNGTEKMNQTLHYLSLPVRLSWTLLRDGNYSLYVGGGASIDYCVYGKRGSETVHIKSIQGSVNSMLGIQYRLGKHLGIYFEPGLSMHIKQHLPVETFWQKNRCTLSLQSGLRFIY